MTFILSAILFPIMAGIFLLVKREIKNRENLLLATGVCLIGESVIVIAACVDGIRRLSDTAGLSMLFHLTNRLVILFKADEISVLFSLTALLIFVCAGFFSFTYMKHEQKEKRYYGYYLIVLGIVMALCFAGNLITFYLFFELLTLTSLPLVLHTESHEAVMGGLKYLFYSLCGAYMVLFGLYFVEYYGNTLTFSAGGVISAQAAGSHRGILLVAACLMLLGFGVKAGMFPMHAWLWSAHPVAPAPASAVLSAVIVKMGVLGIIRVVYYIFGTGFLRGTWVQTLWLCLILVTVFLGSMLAYREELLKKRLAYSTISQVSYILFGLAVMTSDSVTGGLLHVLAHAMVKAVLFLCAGAIIYQTGKTRVGELRGIGKQMPITIWCYTIASLGLIGIPPTGGFVSKWYLAIGALDSGIPVFNWLGPVILLVSALLTAGYLLPVTIKGFFPGEDFDYTALEKKEPSRYMTIPILILTVLSVILGLLPDRLLTFLGQLLQRIVVF